MTGNRHGERTELLKRFSLDSSLTEYMDSNKCIEELLKQLEEEQRNVRREKLAVARLQREVARSRGEETMREKLIHALEEEKRLRMESERRLREATEESELGRAQMVSLQQHFSRMEETVRTLLQNQGALERSAVDTVDIMKAYKDKLSEEVKKHSESLQGTGEVTKESESPAEGSVAEEDREATREDTREETKLLLERLRALEVENSALALENENQREQYERCLDEVANQVVQALLTQKDLREECLKLRTRVFDLEQQNRTLSALFQQRVRPASDLLLQKLHSRIMDLSAGDLLLEPEKSRSFLLSRNTESPPHELHMNGRAGLAVKCRSQLSLTAPGLAYPRSSCSSSEISLSSACSEYSSGSYTWNEGRPYGKLSSLTWEKRVSLGSSAPGNICGPPEEQLPTRKKECHILAGLKRLQKRRPKEPPSLASKSGDKDCMNSNEGIYSLGIKCGTQGVPKPPTTVKPALLGVKVKGFASDSDDADDESPSTRCQRRDSSGRDSWMYSKKLTHSVSDSLCSWDIAQGEDLGVSVQAGSASARYPPNYDSKERAERLTSFTNGFLSSGKSCSARSSFEIGAKEPSISLHLSDTDESEDPLPEGAKLTSNFLQERPQTSPRRLSREADRSPTPPCGRKDPGRAQSADGRPRPFILIKQNMGAKNAQSEECVAVIYDAGDGEPIELGSQHTEVAAQSETRLGKTSTAEYTELVPQQGGKARNYTVLESPEKPVEIPSHSLTGKAPTFLAERGDRGPEHLQKHPPQQQKLIKPSYNHAHKIHSVPPMHTASSPKANLTKIPSRGKGSPQKIAKNHTTEASSNTGSPGSGGQDKSPSSPPVKLSRFIKPHGSSHIQSQVSSKLPGRNDWAKGPPGSPLLPRRHLEQADFRDLPTRDRHCDSGLNELRSPSPPPPPGRSTSLLIRPNYDNSPQALKQGAQPQAPSTVKGPIASSQTHPLHPQAVLNMQHPGSHKGQGAADFNPNHAAEVTPQKLVDSAGHHMPKATTLCQTPTKCSPKRVPTKLYHPSSASVCTTDLHESVSKGSKNMPAPSTLLSSHKISSLQSSLSGKKGHSLENRHPMLYKASSSLPISLEGHPQCLLDSNGSTADGLQAPLSSTGLSVSNHNSEERVSKTRIPIGLKALTKSPPSLIKSSTIPGKQEKDYINTASKEKPEALTLGETLQCRSFDTVPGKSMPELKDSVRCSSMDGEPLSHVLTENGLGNDLADGENRLFKRSISVTTKPHLKPALGMNGAKARSQSFSTHYMEKPCVSVSDGLVRVRTQIITNTGERGNSLTRQSSLGDGLPLKPVSATVASPSQCPFSRQDLNGSISGSSSHLGLPCKAVSRVAPKGDGARNTSKGEGGLSPPQKEVRSLPLFDRLGQKVSTQPMKVASHSLFDSAPSSISNSSDLTAAGAGIVIPSPKKLEQAKNCKKQANVSKGQEELKKIVSPTVCTIEEKVMMGIEENVQKGQGQDKTQASETKQKTGPSLANWFGFRKSKLPALSGKKTETPKGKGEKKELKIGSVLGGMQMKSDKKKDKKKNETQSRDSQDFNEENTDKTGPIIDHCNIKIGQLISQVQCSATHIGKDQFVTDILNGRVAKCNSHGAPLPDVSVGTQATPRRNSEMKGDVEIHGDAATLTQKTRLKAESEVDPAPHNTCQEHMIGSSCQMRTLDSGIGTFPLPDSVARVTGRHLPKAELGPKGAPGGSAEPVEDLTLTPPPKTKVPSCPAPCQHAPQIMGHSLSDPTMPSSSANDLQSQLPKPTTTGLTKAKRRSQSEYSMISARTSEVPEKPAEKKKTNVDHNLSTDWALRVCLYSGSSSDTETEPDLEAATRGPRHQAGLLKTTNGEQGDQEEDLMTINSVGSRLSIMDFCRHELFAHYGKEENRRVSQYELSCQETSAVDNAGDGSNKTYQLAEPSDGQKKPGFSDASLESLNMINSNGRPLEKELRRDSSREEEEPSGTHKRSSGRFDKPGVDNLGSLSDSLYDSFSSCTSQGSNDV